MTRVCPKRDAACPHGDDCPYNVDRYSCLAEPTDRQTFAAPDGADPALNAEGRATGEVRPREEFEDGRFEALPAPAAREPETGVSGEVVLSDAQISYMVDRFLGWHLPADFRPDAGISFEPNYNIGTPWPARHEPTGTNLFDAEQAQAMVRYLVDGLPALSASHRTHPGREEIRNEALEEAAKIVDAWTVAAKSRHLRGWGGHTNFIAAMLTKRDGEVADAIRALKSPPHSIPTTSSKGGE